LDVYVDDKGEILIQEFPLKLVGARVPAALGRTRSASIRRQIEEREKAASDAKAGIKLPTDFDLDTAMRILGGQLAPSQTSESKTSQDKPQ
jgi:hypothetical protein